MTWVHLVCSIVTGSALTLIAMFIGDRLARKRDNKKRIEHERYKKSDVEKCDKTPKKNVKNKPRVETSKILLFVVLVVCFIFIAIIVYGWLILERDSAPELCGIFSGIIATIIGFYCWKAKCENVIKIGKKHPALTGAIAEEEVEDEEIPIG